MINLELTCRLIRTLTHSQSGPSSVEYQSEQDFFKCNMVFSKYIDIFAMFKNKIVYMYSCNRTCIDFFLSLDTEFGHIQCNIDDNCGYGTQATKTSHNKTQKSRTTRKLWPKPPNKSTYMCMYKWSSETGIKGLSLFWVKTPKT